MDQQQRYLLDRIEIQDLQSRYAHALDSHDWSSLEAIFTDDAHLDYTVSRAPEGTRDDVITWMSKTIPGSLSMMQHYVTNGLVTIDGDQATGRLFFYCALRFHDGKLMTIGGYYNDTYRRTAGRWRISERVEEVAFTEGPYEPRTDSDDVPWDD